MKRRIRVSGLAFCLLAGVMIFAFSPKTHPEPTLTPPVGADTNPGFSNDGIVIANDDDPASSIPYQNTREPSTVQTHAFGVRKPTIGSPRMITINNKQYPLRVYQPVTTPNDPFAGQWWEGNAKLTDTWEVERGLHETVLAIIDTGFALKHEEFNNRWYTNPGEAGSTTLEQPSALNCTDRGLALNASCNLIDDDFDEIVDNETGSALYQNPSRLNCSDQGKPLTKDCNRVDDDDNGYVDDVQGWDFINFDNSVQAGELNPTGSGTTHGTMVAGIAAATGDNGVGIAGVDWGTKILPIQALDDDSYGDTWSVGRAIYYAVNQGADVISISLGSDMPDDFIQEAVQAALAEGIVVVAASGNDGCECMVYPARYTEVVAVGALNSSSQPASFSSWGQNLDLLAPGTQLNSPTWSNTNQTAAYASGINGTSLATPMVSGMMTRLLSQQPTATPQQLIAAVSENTNRLTLGATTPHDLKVGFGTLDAHKASLRMVNAVSPSQLYALTPVQKGSHLTPGTDLEKNGSYEVHECEAGSSAATSIYELKAGGGAHFFSISKVEQQHAIALGYTSSIFTYGCVQQPHDNPSVIRNINIFQEFRNMATPR